MDSPIYVRGGIDTGELRGPLVSIPSSIQGSLTNLLLLTSSIMVQMHGLFGNLNNQLNKVRNQTLGLWIGLPNPSPPHSSAQLFAFCRMEPSSDLGAHLPSVRGYVLFSQTYPNGRLTAYFNLKGFPLSDSRALRAMHVHQYRVVDGNCSTTGPHYNPRNVNHPLHPGDFNNFQVLCGKIVAFRTNLRANLFGPESIVGRGLVLHEKEDDLGLGGNQASLRTGNSGRRLACGTITLSKGDRWRRMVPDL
ncbi:extracellular superoxide dismutase [Cu-Zn]-like [Pristis pectinata]|uniref:extracellular superoxide dismutase [Cu-Zn]-like n=1 Tax=Pristis pectinata TaxID=685728 RepID=UPI00223D6100|nr:extracellular superoxide dismutase [Cu-Zn]-like [Pristis pectinata]